jgi:hypothetical protein
METQKEFGPAQCRAGPVTAPDFGLPGTAPHGVTVLRASVSISYSEPISICVTFEVFTAVTMKNVVFWDIRTQFVLHRRHVTSPLQSPAS